MVKKTYSVSLNEEHAAFINNESRQFNLSKFVRVSLDAYIDYVRRLRDNGETDV